MNKTDFMLWVDKYSVVTVTAFCFPFAFKHFIMVLLLFFSLLQSCWMFLNTSTRQTQTRQLKMTNLIGIWEVFPLSLWICLVLHGKQIWGARWKKNSGKRGLTKRGKLAEPHSPNRPPPLQCHTGLYFFLSTMYTCSSVNLNFLLEFSCIFTFNYRDSKMTSSFIEL